jgi:hypothetical protein
MLARLLGIDLKTLHNWYRRGKIGAHKSLGGQLIFEAAEVLKAYDVAKAEDPAVELPAAFAEYVRTGALPPTTRRRLRVAKPSAETRGAA